MLVVPLLVGTLVSGERPVHALLAIAWLVGYHAFNAAGLWRRTRRHPERVLPALATWGALTALAGVPLLWWHPELLGWAPVFAPLVVVAAVWTWRGRDRDLLCRASAVAASSLMVAVSAGLGSAPPEPRTTWLLTGFVMWHFLGTVPYVRSLIRGAGDVRWVVGACLWYTVGTVVLVALASAGWRAWSMAWLGVLLTARAVLVPWWQRTHARLRPMVIGLAEIALCVPLAAVAIIVGTH